MSEAKTTKHTVGMAAPRPGELDAMYNFFQLMELLYQQGGEPEDVAEEFPEAWGKYAVSCFTEDPENWKGHLIEEIFKFYSINTGWRRVIGGFDCLFTEVCDPEETVLSYKKYITDSVNVPAVHKRVVFPDGHSYLLPDLTYAEFLHSDLWTGGRSDAAYDEYLRIRGMQAITELSNESLQKVKVVVHYKGEEMKGLERLEEVIESEKVKE